MANKDKLIASAQKFLVKGQTSKAIGEYQKLVAAFPKDVRNRQKLADLLSRNRQKEEAIDEYEKVARNYSETGFYLKAIAVYKQMQKLVPERADFYGQLAELNEKQGLIGNALSEYRNLVAYYEENNLASEAIPVLEKMLSLDSGNLNVKAKLIDLKFAARDEDAADQFLEMVAGLREKQEHTKIIRLYDRFRDHLADSHEATQHLACALIASGQAEKAVPILKSLFKTDSENHSVIRSLADAYAKVGDHENARLTYRHLLKIAPDDFDVRELYVRSCFDAADPEKALEYLEEVKNELFEAERTETLREFYETLKELLPDDDRVSNTLSAIYEAVGEEAPQADAAQPEPADTEEEIDTTIQVDSSDDVEELDVVGESVVPEKVTEEGTASLPELDLDLDFDGTPAAAEEMSASSTQEVSEEEPEDVELDLELSGLAELDLDGVDVDIEETTETEGPADAGSPIVEEARMAPFEGESQEDEETSDLSATTSFEERSEAGEDAESEVVSADTAADESPDTEMSDAVPDALTSELGDESEPAGAIEDVEEIEEVDVIEDAEEIEELEDIEELDALEQIEDLEELDEVETIEELEDLEEVEELEEVVSADMSPHATDTVQRVPELEDAEFLLQQGLWDDAESVLREALATHGDHPDINAKLIQVAEQRLASTADDDTIDFSDMLADLNEDELLGAADFLGGDARTSEESDDLIQELATDLDTADTESHYNLGIAYKEMGLFEDAITEFDKAAGSPTRTLDCLTLKGQCAVEMGDFELAESTLKEGLGQANLALEGKMTIHYELGLAYRAAGRLLEALESFQVVADHDLFFRDVGEIVRDLRNELGLDGDTDDDGQAGGSRDRISFV